MTNAKRGMKTKMDADRLWEEYRSLSPEGQQQLVNFLAQLKSRQNAKAKQRFDWSKSPFIGMWRDRDDMTDGAGWVRNLREREWPRQRR